MSPRVIARQEHDAAFLIETREDDGRRYGRIYDRRRDEVFPEMLVISIAARGGWLEVEPGDYSEIIGKLAGRLS
jgi:hypothetical protein